MTITFTVAALNPYNNAVQVTLQPSVAGAPPNTPAPPAFNVYMSQADGDEMELGEKFSVEVKPDKP